MVPPVISAFGRLRQEDLELETSLSYRIKPHFSSPHLKKPRAVDSSEIECVPSMQESPSNLTGLRGTN